MTKPAAYLRNLTDPQPLAVTDLKYRAWADVEDGVEYVPVFLANGEVPDLTLDDIQRVWNETPGTNQWACTTFQVRFAERILEAARAKTVAAGGQAEVQAPQAPQVDLTEVLAKLDDLATKTQDGNIALSGLVRGESREIRRELAAVSSRVHAR